jgi:site-specific recombinase XerD
MVLRNFIWYCRHSQLPIEPQKLSAIHIRQFMWYLSNEVNKWDSASPLARRRVSASTAHDYYRALHSFFNWLEREGLIHDNPFTYLKPPSTEDKVIEALTTDEIERLLGACAANTIFDIRNKAMISMLLDSGLRVSELAGLTLNDVDLNSGSILVRHGKGKKQRVVHIGSKAPKALWKYVTTFHKSESNRLFVNRIGEPLDVIGIKILIRRLGGKSEFESPSAQATPHLRYKLSARWR